MEILLREDFEPCLNQSFTINLRDSGIQARLVEVKALGHPFRDGAREPFSLLFEADTHYGLLNQGSYPMANSVLGEKTLFLVPVGVKQNRYQYEAVFN
jgi:hypothetical protein